MVNRKGILVVSFGTGYKETCEKTIVRLENDLQSAFPKRHFYRAWTSNKIIHKLKVNDNISIMTVSEALEQMLKDGITDILVQSTHLIPGIEYEQLLGDIDHYRKNFERIQIGMPLLYSEEDKEVISRSFLERMAPAEDKLLICMGHGSAHEANSVYQEMNTIFHKLGYTNCYMATVEADPSLQQVLKNITVDSAKKIILTPFMLVAGDHAINDMAGEGADSWKVSLVQMGYEVECVIRGLGEYEEIRNIYIAHDRQAEMK